MAPHLYNTVLCIQDSTQSVGGAASMKRLHAVAYKQQIGLIACALVSAVISIVFLLISVGVTSLLWWILAASFAGASILCGITGGIWCVHSMRSTDRNHSISIKNYEDEQTVCTTVIQQVPPTSGTFWSTTGQKVIPFVSWTDCQVWWLPVLLLEWHIWDCNVGSAEMGHCPDATPKLDKSLNG